MKPSVTHEVRASSPTRGAAVTEVRVDYARVRPPVAALSNRDAAADFRDSVFPATAWSNPAMRVINLGGITNLTLGAITELLAPVIRGLASRSYGNLAIGVITSDEPVVIWLGSMAAEFRAPVFLAATVDDAPRALRPAGALTQVDSSTLDHLISEGGATTASELARTSGLEAAAASNRLANLERKGYVWRLPRSRREGDLYVDPGTRWASTPTAIAAGTTSEQNEGWRASVTDAAAATGRDPDELLAEAWQAYLSAHMEGFNAKVATAARRLEQPAPSGDEDDLARWAAAAAQRMRDG